jgi:hypothetical protein
MIGEERNGEETMIGEERNGEEREDRRDEMR